ncbi:MAG: hypothetical protein AB7F99_09775 [Vicinamibacterales bacterium]
MRLARTADQLIPELAQYQRRFLLAAGAGALLSALGLVLDHARFFQSYLMAYMLVLGASLGCLALGMIHQLSGGAWGVVTRRMIGASSRILPILTVLFLPIAFGMHDLYHWTHEEVVAADEILQRKQLYLNVPFFLIRAAIYFAIWNALVYFLNTWSLEQDRTGDPTIPRRMQKLSGGGLVVFALTVTFASFDWLMSLDPHWFSTIYGVLIMGGQGLTALALLIIMLTWLSRRPPLDTIVVSSHFHDLANLMLAFVLLWAYFSFSQYLIIYSANLPEEITWYTRRLLTGWRSVGVFLVVFHFALPFAILLSRKLKRHPALLVKVAIGILVVRLVDLMWLIAPELNPDGFSIHWLDLVLPLTLASLWTGLFFRELRGRAILPVHDPQFGEAIGPLIQQGSES